MTEPLTTPPVDILDELKAEFEEWDARDGVTAVVSTILLRDAISEIEALRAELSIRKRQIGLMANCLMHIQTASTAPDPTRAAATAAIIGASELTKEIVGAR